MTTCAEAMKTNLRCCETDQDVQQAARLMREGNFGFLPICDQRGIVVGTLTDRDLTLRVLGESRDPATTRVADVMTRDVIGCSPRDDLWVAEDLMSRHKISRVLCLNEEGRALGIISLADIAAVETNGRAAAILRSVTQREQRDRSPLRDRDPQSHDSASRGH